MENMFAVIHDTRRPGYIRHKLSDVLQIGMCAVMSGMDELRAIYAYAQNKAEFLRKQFGIESIPSKATLSRIPRMIDGKAAADVIMTEMKKKIGETGDGIAVDGKAIRSASESGKGHSALQMLTAYLTESGVILGQEKIHEKTNEMPVFQDMLSYLNIKRKTVTADATHCQKETGKKIIKKGGDYAFGLKEGQKSLYSEEAHVALTALRKYAIAMRKKYLLTFSRKPSVKRNMFNCLMDDSIWVNVIAAN